MNTPRLLLFSWLALLPALSPPQPVLADTSRKPGSTKLAPEKSPSVPTFKPSAYDRLLLDLKADAAIRKLSAPLNQALAQEDFILASSIMQMIAIAFRMDENDAAAVQAAQIAGKLNPQNPNCRFQLAEYLLRDGRWQEAEQIYQKLSQDSNNMIARRATAFLTMLCDSPDAARHLLQKYVEENPEDRRAITKLACIYQFDEDFCNAANLQRKLADLANSNYLKEIYLGRAFEAEKKIAEAESCFKRAGTLNKEDPLWHCQLALLYMKQQKIKEADTEFRACFASKRMLSAPYSNWSVMEAFFGNSAKAQRCLAYALKVRPHASEFYFARGVINERAGHADAAIEDFQKSISFFPHNSSTYMHLIQLYQNRKEPQGKCSELCLQWRKYCPQSISCRIELGNIQKRQGHDTEALKMYREAEQLSTDFKPEDKDFSLKLCIMHANIASILYKEKDFKSSLAEAAEFNAQRPQAPSTAGLSMRPPKLNLDKLKGKERKAAEHALFADALYETGQLSEAAAEYREAEKDSPDNIVYHSCLLKVLLDKKDYAQAAKEDAAVSHHFITHVSDLFSSGKNKNTAAR